MSSFRGTLTDMELALRGSSCLRLSDPDVVQSPQTHFDLLMKCNNLFNNNTQSNTIMYR